MPYARAVDPADGVHGSRQELDGQGQKGASDQGDGSDFW